MVLPSQSYQDHMYRFITLLRANAPYVYTKAWWSEFDTQSNNGDDIDRLCSAIKTSYINNNVSIYSPGWSDNIAIQSVGNDLNGFCQAKIIDDTSVPWQKIGTNSDCEDFAFAAVALHSHIRNTAPSGLSKIGMFMWFYHPNHTKIICIDS